MSIKLIDTNISVTPLDNSVDTTPQRTLVESAWKLSRPLSRESYEDVTSVDAPICEFIHASYDITVPIYLREVLVSPRDHIAWSTTTRAMPVDVAWPVYRLKEYSSDYSRLGDNLLRLRDQGIQQDEFRLELPLGYCSRLAMKYSLRTVAKLVKYLDYLSWKTKDDSYHELATKIVSATGEQGLANDLSKMIANHGFNKFLSESSSPLREGIIEPVQRIGNLVVVTEEIPIAFRTHLIRHRGLHVSDNLFKILSMWSGAVATLPLRSPMICQSAGTVEAWDHVIETRACWIAQASLWGKIVAEYTKVRGLFRPPLPCDNSLSCIYKLDNELRRQRKDPNPACPIYIRLEKLTPTNDEISHMVHHSKNRSPFWTHEISHISESSSASTSTKEVR